MNETTSTGCNLVERELGVFKEKPTETGLWLYRCTETKNEWTSIIINKSRSGLVTCCRCFGKTLLDDFHSSLTNIEWRRPQFNI